MALTVDQIPLGILARYGRAQSLIRQAKRKGPARIVVYFATHADSWVCQHLGIWVKAHSFAVHHGNGGAHAGQGQ